MATEPDLNPIQLAFTEAVRQFKSKLKNTELYADILKTKSIDEVYDKTDALQIELGKQGRIRNLSKIRPFLEGLRSYADIIDTFVQVKPDVLALIWGPIKLLLQWASSLTQSLDAIINTVAEIGGLLPDFKLMATMFGHNERIKHVLVLFFQDILDFYAVALKFFTLPHWRFMFEALWPSQKERIKLTVNHIERDTDLMRTKVNLEHIREEHEHRQRAYDHFEATKKSSTCQEYNIIKTDISPKSYGADLYRIRSQVCAGTGNWLKQDSDFKKWLDLDDDSTRLLWLCGIPGAGKTHLASMAIDYATSVKTIFAFISHTNKNNTSALSIMHSLMFQLASEDECLQAVLCGLSRKQLNVSLEVAVEVLQTLLNSTNPVSIIVDGVDEIDSVERERLLKNLCDITTACKKTRLLISSRAEHDISTILSEISSTIRVDTHNTTSIQIFIDDWTKKWFSDRKFLPADKSEIEDLFKPLALKAKGMFLYAKIMLSSIEESDNLDEIRNELRVLPESLDEAYERVFAKIVNKSNASIKRKCRLILGWISCSPTPLTLPELEQALALTISGTCRVSSRLNFIRLCGPIIEVVGDHIQFVHFTVKEYIHSRHQIDYYIDPIEATLSLTICCLQYLCQGHHSPDISDEDVKKGIEMGNYRLHYYATNAWLKLIIQYLRLNPSKTISEELIEALTEFHDERGNQEYHEHMGLKELWYPPELQRFQSHDPDLFSFLQSFAQFQKKCSTSLYNLKEEHYWIDSSPITISNVSKMLYTQFDQYQCNSQQHPDHCLCPTLSWHYGQRLYKCDFLSCPFNQEGFTTSSLRDLHKKCHDASWKCDVPSCHYSKVGFLSKAMRDKHLDSHCTESQVNQPSNETLPLNLDSSNLQPLLFDLVSINDVTSVEKLPPFFKQLSHGHQEELLRLVGDSASPAMAKLIYERAEEHMQPAMLREFIVAFIDGQNIESLRLLLSDNDDKIAKGIISHGYMSEIYQILSRSIAVGSMGLIRVVEHLVVGHFAKCRRTPLEAYTHREVVKATARCLDREEYLIRAWSTYGIASWSYEKLSGVLRHVAATTCSIRLSQVLLQHGATVDGKITKASFTPLYWAARKDSAEAARLIKFLLYQGAIPDGMSHLDGPRNISKWLGVSWDELVQRVTEDRKRGIQWP